MKQADPDGTGSVAPGDAAALGVSRRLAEGDESAEQDFCVRRLVPGRAAIDANGNDGRSVLRIIAA
jgi:hypothetical protein